MEGLCLLLKKFQTDGDITCIKISHSLEILNIFFVDDVLIMTKASLSESKAIDSLLSTFFQASGLLINPLKSTFHFSILSKEELSSLSSLFPFKFMDLLEGFKYLGFFLKTTIYRVEDWRWLIHKYEKWIGLWCHR